WEKTHKLPTATFAELARPVRLFAARKDDLTYSSGKNTWVLRGADGSESKNSGAVFSASEHTYQSPDDGFVIEADAKTGKVVGRYAILRRPSAFRFQSGRLYAFTADGHAYAMRSP